MNSKHKEKNRKKESACVEFTTGMGGMEFGQFLAICATQHMKNRRDILFGYKIREMNKEVMNTAAVNEKMPIRGHDFVMIQQDIDMN